MRMTPGGESGGGAKYAMMDKKACTSTCMLTWKWEELRKIQKAPPSKTSSEQQLPENCGPCWGPHGAIIGSVVSMCILCPNEHCFGASLGIINAVQNKSGSPRNQLSSICSRSPPPPPPQPLKVSNTIRLVFRSWLTLGSHPQEGREHWGQCSSGIQSEFL